MIPTCFQCKFNCFRKFSLKRQISPLGSQNWGDEFISLGNKMPDFCALKKKQIFTLNLRTNDLLRCPFFTVNHVYDLFFNFGLFPQIYYCAVVTVCETSYWDVFECVPGAAAFHWACSGDLNVLLWTTNVILKCLAMRVLLAYLCIYVCVFLLPHVFVYRTAVRLALNHSTGFVTAKHRYRCAALYGKGRLKPVQTLSPSDPRLEWLDKQVPFPNCVWRGNCARRAAAGPMAAAKRVHFVQHTRRIWRADVLSTAIQLQT